MQTKDDLWILKDIYEVWDRFEKSSLSELKLSLGGDKP